jgi:hypothetical protein
MGFFNKARLCDMLIIGDHVQYRRYGFQNRVKIKTRNGAQWLTVPIVHEGDQPINTVKIFQENQNGSIWHERHLNTLQANYEKAKYYDEYIDKFEKTYKKGYEFLADLNLEFIKNVFEILELNIPIKKTSEMNLTESKTELIIEIANKVGADAYLSGIRGIRYLEESAFQNNNKVLRYTKFEHPRYNQQFMDLGFIEGLSILDLIFNEGPQSLEILRSGFPGF